MTRDSERAATLKALFLYTDSVRRTGASFRHATGQKDAVNALREATQRRGVVGAVFCAGWKTTLWCGRTARSLSAWAYPRMLTLFGSARERFRDCEAGGGAPEDHQA